MKKYGFGVDIGGTTCKLGLFETAGTLLEKWEIPTDISNEGENILPNIAKSLNEKMQEQIIQKDDIEGIGIGLPGPVRRDGVVPACVNLGWKNINVAKELEALMPGFKVKAANDANVAALGEMWQGGGRGCKNMVMVTLGTGVGCGIIIDGEIVPGSNGAGGEIGHMTVNRHETVPSMLLQPESCVWRGSILPKSMRVLCWKRLARYQPRRYLMYIRMEMIRLRRQLLKNLPGFWEMR